MSKSYFQRFCEAAQCYLAVQEQRLRIFYFGLFDPSIYKRTRMMRKSVRTREYATFLELLIDVRHRAGLTQSQLGQRLPFEQPAISKIERGERRVDVIELKMICVQLGITLHDFISELEDRLARRHV